jgi:hypothetical protein
MKINFRKISAIAASALMTGMTLGVAAAANYPAPFVSGGVANVAVVYGTGAGVSSLDMVQAGNIQDSLGEYVSGGSVVVEGGESFALEKNSDKFNMGDHFTDLYTTLNDGKMPEFLADGTYDSGNVDQDYTQTITLTSTKDLGLFADSDYNNKEPTLGFHFVNDDPILDYQIKFGTTGVPFEDLADTDMPLMGSSYYVLSVSSANDSITLLDSAEKVVLSEGDTVTVGEKSVSLEYIDQDYVKFNVDGEITKKLTDHGYMKLNDGSYIVANEIMWASKESGVSKVEFSVGKGKIVLESGKEVEVNDETVDGLTATLGGYTTDDLTSVTFTWVSDGEQFLTIEDALTMPTFNAIKVVYGGLTFPDSSEKISLENAETLTLTMENYELPLMWWDGADALLGEDGNLLKLAVGANTQAYTTTGYYNASDLSTGIEVQEDNRFLVTSLADDLADVNTVYYEVSTIDYNAEDDFTVTLKDLIGDSDLTFTDEVGAGTEEEVGDVTVTLTAVTTDYAYFDFTTVGTEKYNVAVSETGLLVTLPSEAEVAALTTAIGASINFTEANTDGDVGGAAGKMINATVKATTDDVLHVSDTSLTELESTSDVYIAYNPSELATKVTLDKSGDNNNFEIEYYGVEVPAKVDIVGGTSTVTSGSSVLGNILVKDTEVSSVATKNLIVVGGSCINSAAAALVGGTKCGAAWTTATGIGSGQFLIKGYADSTLTTGVALLVAGYDAEDTVKATTYLTNKVVDTSKAYKGTTSTELAVVID